MPLTAGTLLGPYEIAAAIGAGGMGEVYRARDTKLARDVAIKVLPEHFAEDKDRMARFEREARVLASLNHPNIAGIYGVEASGDASALVLELVEGPTLADRIAQGAIPYDEVIAIARQMADALEAAHEAGIIHRDLKPANVKVKDDGTVKILDFGLAKALGGDEREGDPSESPTLTTAATGAGVIMGTAAYMSPEQAKGKKVDRRADVWGFGAVVYEMLTRKRPLMGEDISETLAFVLTKEPDWTALPPDVAPGLRTFLMRCFEKDPRRRVRDMGDLRLAIDGAFDAVTGTAEAVSVVRSKLPWVVAVVASLLTGLTVWSLTRSEPPAVRRFAYDLPDDQRFRNPGRAMLAVAPDGSRFVYNASGGLYLRSMDQLDARLLPGTEDSLNMVFFSPDGGSVAYQQSGQIKRLALSGGAPVVVCSLPSRTLGGYWAPDGTIFFGAAEGIFRVPANGGTPAMVVAAAEGEFLDAPQLLPDGDSLLFSGGTGVVTGTGGSWDNASIVAVSLTSGERTVLLEGGSDARYVDSGHLVYALENGLFAVAFDAQNLQVMSGPVSMVEGVFRAGTSSSANFAVSDDGTLFYVTAGSASSPPLSWVDRNGNVEVIETIPPSRYVWPRLSPDGARVLVVADGDAHVFELASGRQSRLTDDGATNYLGWTPSGDEVTYTSGRGGSKAKSGFSPRTEAVKPAS